MFFLDSTDRVSLTGTSLNSLNTNHFTISCTLRNSEPVNMESCILKAPVKIDNLYIFQFFCGFNPLKYPSYKHHQLPQHHKRLQHQQEKHIHTLSYFSRQWLFQISRAASGREAECICLFRTSLSFRVQQNIFPLSTYVYVKGSLERKWVQFVLSMKCPPPKKISLI